MNTTQTLAVRDDAEVARMAAGLVLDARVNTRGSDFGLALSGGRIAPVFFGELLRQAGLRGLDLGGLDYFWADERAVPPDHVDSNYRVFRETFLARCSVPAARVHRWQSELPPAAAVAAALADWDTWVARRAQRPPAFDLVVLGVGEDGHIASLFPENLLVDLDARAWFRAVIGSKPPPQRLTLGYPLLWSASLVLVLATGAGKDAVVRGSLDGSRDLPLARVLRGREATGRPTVVLAPARTLDSGER